MFTQSVLKVKKPVAAAMLLPAPTSGCAGSVKNPGLSVRPVPTANCCPSRMKSSGAISPEWTSEDEPFVIGVYPMLLDETCRFLAMDFDGDELAE